MRAPTARGPEPHRDADLRVRGLRARTGGHAGGLVQRGRLLGPPGIAGRTARGGPSPVRVSAGSRRTRCVRPRRRLAGSCNRRARHGRRARSRPHRTVCSARRAGA